MKGKYNYGKKFTIRLGNHNMPVMYRYLNKKKSSKTLVDARSKKPIIKTR